MDVQFRTMHMSIECLKWYTNLRVQTERCKHRALSGAMEETERQVKMLKSNIQVNSESGSIRKAKSSSELDRD